MSVTVPYNRAKPIMAFLQYLHDHFSRRINPKDPFLIAAVYAWWMQEGLGSLGNNPFNIRNSPMAVSYRRTSGNGKFAVFASLSKGFEAAAYLLMHGGWGTGVKDADRYGYRLAIRGMMKGGNQGAVDFLAAMAMSKWSADHYGADTWPEAYDPKKNHLLRNYTSIGGVQATNPNPPKPKPIPQLPRDFNYKVVVRDYLDPWAVKALYERRHSTPKV